MDLKRNRFSSFSGTKPNFTPFWSPDGNKLYYASYRDDPKVSELYVYDFQSREENKIDLNGEPMSWFDISDVSADGKELLCFGKGRKGLSELYLVDLEKLERTKLTSNNINEWGGVCLWMRNGSPIHRKRIWRVVMRFTLTVFLR